MSETWKSVLDITLLLAILPASQLAALILLYPLHLKKNTLYLPLFVVLYALVALGMMHVALLREGRDWRYIRLFEPMDVLDAAYGVLGGLLLIPLFWGGYRLLKRAGADLRAPFQSVRALMGNSTGGMFSFMFAAAFGGGVLEEILFRGYLLTRLDETLPAFGALLISTAAFAIFHLPVLRWLGVLNSAVAGLMLGGLFLSQGGLAAPILAHMTVNCCMTVLIYKRMIGAEELE